MIDVTILTDERYVNPKITDEYVENVLFEDRLVGDAIERLGLSTNRVAWSDLNYDWSQSKKVLFRTTWDYAERFEDFYKWLQVVSKQTTLINHVETVLWNLDKHYLQDLQHKGVNIVETIFVEKGDKRSLKELHVNEHWQSTILKPAISAAAKDTYKLNYSNLDDYEEIYKKLIQKEAMLLQPFQNNVVERGEVSIMMMGGEYTHAVLKKAKPGDFRVQDDFGGTVHAYEPTEEEKDLATAAVAACEIEPLYARVDIVTDNNGKAAISELELIEPELWFRRCEKAADVLAKGILKSFE